MQTESPPVEDALSTGTTDRQSIERPRTKRVDPLPLVRWTLVATAVLLLALTAVAILFATPAWYFLAAVGILLMPAVVPYLAVRAAVILIDR